MSGARLAAGGQEADRKPKRDLAAGLCALGVACGRRRGRAGLGGRRGLQRGIHHIAHEGAEQAHGELGA